MDNPRHRDLDIERERNRQHNHISGHDCEVMVIKHCSAATDVALEQ
jgi:hypothetical protein